MIDYPTALMASVQLVAMTLGMTALVVAIGWLGYRMVQESGAKSAQSLGAIVAIVAIVLALSWVLYVGGDPATINGLVHGAH